MDEATSPVHSGSKFNSERPISSPEQDELGRYPFAEQFAAALRHHTGEDSLVVALNGAWGTGKSSVWKLAHFALTTDQHRRTPPIVYFPLWEISGAEALAAEFFSRVSTTIDQALADAGQPKLGGLFLRYGERVAGGLETVGRLSEAAHDAGLPWIGPIGKALGSITGWLRGSRAALKARITAALRRLPGPVIVVFDDIDRLTADEVALLFRLVKANCEFPRLVYVLLFDRKYAQTALDGVTGQRGAEFIEKIVQVTIDVPPPDTGQLRGILEVELAHIRSELVSVTPWEDQRLNMLLDKILLHAVRHIRDLRRFVNSLRFHVGTLTEHGIFQGNFIDLAALEAARIWTPEFHSALPRHRARLVRIARKPTWHGRGTDWHEWFEMLVALAGPSHKKMAQGILELVFCAGEKSTIRQSEDEFLAHRRAAHGDFFDLHFRFQLSGDALGRHEVNALLESADSLVLCIEALRRYLLEGRLPVVLDYLGAHKADSVVRRQTLVQALVDFSDEVVMSKRPELDSYTVATGLEHVIITQLCSEKDAETRAEMVIEIVRAARSLTGVMEIGGYELYEQRRAQRSNRDWLVPTARLDELRAALLSKVESLQESALPKLGRYRSMYLAAWADWGAQEEVAAWIRHRLASPEGFLYLVECFSTPTSESLSFNAAAFAALIPWREVLTARRRHFGRGPADSTNQIVVRFDASVAHFRERRKAKRRERKSAEAG